MPGHRSLFVDGLKALAALLIVAHHLAYYGPMADAAATLAPELFAFLADEARMVVQVFLVIGGFMAARTLAPAGRLKVDAPLPTLVQRAARLVVPYWFAVGLTLAASHLTLLWMDHPSVSPMPGLGDLLLNLLLLSQIAGRDSISAGAWYVAIDLQLYALTLGLLALARRLARAGGMPAAQGTIGRGLIGLVMLAALFHFNLDATTDAWAVYFMGAYGLGAAAWWGGNPARSRSWFAAAVLAALLALGWEWRDRLFIAFTVALMLYAWRRVGERRAAPRPLGDPPAAHPAGPARLVGWLGTRSYALFLVHFPVCLVVNGLFTAYAPATAGWQALGVLAALFASVAAARVFYDWVEAPVLALTRLPARSEPQRLATT